MAPVHNTGIVAIVLLFDNFVDVDVDVDGCITTED